MLNNPNWKQDIFTVKSLINWLEQQRLETTYIYSSGMDCLLCRYFRAMGLDVECVYPTQYSVGGRMYPLPDILNSISLKGSGTYGRALAVAKYVYNNGSSVWDF